MYFIVEFEGTEGPDILVTLGESVVRLLLERLISVTAVRGEKAVSASRCSRQLVRESEVRRRSCGPRNTAPPSSCSWLPSATSTCSNIRNMRQEAGDCNIKRHHPTSVCYLMIPVPLYL